MSHAAQRSPHGGRGPLLAVAILLAAEICPSPRQVHGADSEEREEKKAYLPVAPEPEYYRLRNLMANGVMPNYKAAWYGFRHQDLANMKLSLQYIAALAGESSRYPLPQKEGSLEDFRRRMEDLRAKAQTLSEGIGPSMDRSAVNDRILSIYQACQSCHDVYAPAERKDARKYTPPR